jgi:hypothetical protein
MARPRTVVPENTRRSIIAQYNKGVGLVDIAEATKFSSTVVRRCLIENSVSLRGRGRPRKNPVEA